MSLIASLGRASLCLACLLLASTTGAQELILGFEGDSLGGNALAMPIFSFPSTGKNSLVVQANGGYLYYTIRGTTDTVVHSPGGSLSLGWRARTARATFTVGAGYEVRHKESIPETGPSTTVTERGITIQGNAYFMPNPLTALTLIATYGDANRYTWVRGGYKRQLTNKRFEKPTSWSIGGEVTGQGNNEVTTYQIGLVGGPSWPKKKMSLEVRAGISQRQSPGGPKEHLFYGGVGFYKDFTPTP
jgi:cellulose biosynthesis protein BcsS